MDSSSQSTNVIPFPQRDGSFVETRSARLIQETLAFARENAALVCIYGGPGVGKTTSIAEFKAAFEHVWIATISPSSSTLVPVLEEIAESVGITEPTGGARKISHAIRARLRTLKGILIIDEAQHLRPAALEEIRAIHDASRVGLAFVGNESVFARIAGGGRQASFAQIFSRIGMRLYLSKPTGEDVRKLCKDRWNTTDADVLALLEQVASQPGALRLVVQIMSSVTKRGGAVTAERVRKACVVLGVEVA